MVVTEITHFGAGPNVDANAPLPPADETIQKAFKAIRDAIDPDKFVLGTRVENNSVIQITSEGFDTSSPTIPIIERARSVLGEPQSKFHVDFKGSAFGKNGPATANVVEYVQIWFPVSHVTLDFQRKIEKDFERFDEIFIKEAYGSNSWTSGWVQEEQKHDAIKDEKAKCFLVVRGWQSMRHFEESLSTDAYKEAAPILFAWNAPFEMWHVERKDMES